MTDKEKIKHLEEKLEFYENLRTEAGEVILRLVMTPFISRRKIRKLYKTNGCDILRTAKLYLEGKRCPYYD